MECKEITVKDVKGLFSVKSSGDVYELTIGSAKPIIVSLPFVLDKDIARICGMIFDGYLAKILAVSHLHKGKILVR
jgi:hypothetical protein